MQRRSNFVVEIPKRMNTLNIVLTDLQNTAVINLLHFLQQVMLHAIQQVLLINLGKSLIHTGSTLIQL